MTEIRTTDLPCGSKSPVNTGVSDGLLSPRSPETLGFAAATGLWRDCAGLRKTPANRKVWWTRIRCGRKRLGEVLHTAERSWLHVGRINPQRKD